MTFKVGSIYRQTIEKYGEPFIKIISCMNEFNSVRYIYDVLNDDGTSNRNSMGIRTSKFYDTSEYAKTLEWYSDGDIPLYRGLTGKIYDI